MNKKSGTFYWLMHFARFCKGKLIASVLLAVLGSASGIVPYLAVSGILVYLFGGGDKMETIMGYALWG